MSQVFGTELMPVRFDVLLFPVALPGIALQRLHVQSHGCIVAK